MNVNSLLNGGGMWPQDEGALDNNGDAIHSESAGTSTSSTGVHTPIPTPSPEEPASTVATQITQSQTGSTESSSTDWQGAQLDIFANSLNGGPLMVKQSEDSPTGAAFAYHESHVVPRGHSSPRLHSHKFSASTASNLSSYTTSSMGSHSQSQSQTHSHNSSMSTTGEAMSSWLPYPEPYEVPKSTPPPPPPASSPDATGPYGGQEAPADSGDKTVLSLAPDYMLEDIDSDPVCMFKENCDTESQLRKAISHILGRNKICTRQIPDNIWVHFCRKHYQRCRYRNASDYAKLQCRLVIWQIRRVQIWSDRNVATNQLGVLTAWTLGIRKREQNRIADRVEADPSLPTTRKRPYSGYEHTGAEVVAQEKPRVQSPHAIPDWLLRMCGRKFDTQGTIALFERIRQELDENTLNEIPDIEILPSITHDPNEEMNYKRYEKHKKAETRVTTRSGHTRTQSGNNSAWCSVGKEVSQYQPLGQSGGFWGSAAVESQPGPTGIPFSAEPKRQRVDNYGAGYPTQDVAHRTTHRIVPQWRGSQSYLPAPVAQRPGTQSTAQQLEETDYSAFAFNDRVPRNPHQRSQSDTSSFRHLPPMQASNPSQSRFPSVNPALTNLSSAPSYHYRTNPFYLPDPARQVSGHGESFGTRASSTPYGGDVYSSNSLGQLHSYADLTARQQPQSQQHQTPFTSTPGSAAYYSAPPDPSSSSVSRQGHTRHQSTPAISYTSHHMYTVGSGFHSAVIPPGYPPVNDPNHQGYQHSYPLPYPVAEQQPSDDESELN